jgi:acetoacetyl-CoA synthase
VTLLGSARRWLDKTRAEHAFRRCNRVGASPQIDGIPTVENAGTITLGDRFRIGSVPVPSHLAAQHGGELTIGHDVTIAHGAAIATQEKIVIGDGTRIGPFCVVMDTDFHVAGDANAQHATSPVIIGKGVRIGSHVTILRGTVLGDGVQVDSGSVVNGVTPPQVRIGGVPARILATDAERIAAAMDVGKALPRVVMRALGLESEPTLDDGRDTIEQWDSLGNLKLVLAIEEAFDVGIDAHDLLHTTTIRGMIPVIEKARGSGVESSSPRSIRRRPITFHSPRARNPEPMFVPEPAAAARAQVTAFARFVAERTGASVATPDALHAFSVERFREFWSLFVEWSGLPLEGAREPVCVGDEIEAAVFFPELRLNFTECLLRSVVPGDDAAPAITAANEAGQVVRLTRGELRRRVLAVAAALKARGVQAGDRVVAIAANDADAVVACLGSAAIGATWSSVSPELGPESILARFEQLGPKVLFYRASYLDQGKRVDVAPRVTSILAGLPTAELAVSLGEEAPSVLPQARAVAHASLASLVDEGAPRAPKLEELPRFPFNHPLFVLFSSGTTGKPKCIMHGAGGTLLEHQKEHRLHGDLRPEDKLYFHTTCAWMMWNWLVSALGVGAEIVVYEGSVSYPEIDSLWQLAAREKVTVLGTSPAFLQFTASAAIAPNERCDLSCLRAVMSTGSILPDTAFDWVRDHVARVPVQSISGGTDILGCFLLGHPALPVYSGELQSKSLGLDVRPFGAGDGKGGEPIGELVCARPFPSRPIGLYGDAGGEKFHATYFSQNAGYWTHGDRFEWTARGTGRIHGRSDGVMNIRGIRIGPAEIYGALADVDEVVEAMAVEQRDPSEPGGSRLVLLVVLRDEKKLDHALLAKIKDTLAHRCSRAHVPSVVLRVTELPVTHNGKRAERAARDAVNGDPVGNIEALRNPACIDAIREALAATKRGQAA